MNRYKSNLLFLSLFSLMLASLACAGTVSRTVTTINVPAEGVGHEYVSQASASGQWFNVPEGHCCTEVAMRVWVGNTANTYPGHSVILRVRDSSGVIATLTETANLFVNPRWMRIEGLSLESGDYHVQVLTTSSSLDPSLKAFVESSPIIPDIYPDGYAATGWSGETAIGNGIDFQIEFKLVPAIPTIDVDVEGTAYEYVPTASAAGQWFTVPERNRCTEVAMKVLLGGAAGAYPTHTVIFRLKDSAGVWHTLTEAASQFSADGSRWMRLTGLNLGPGSYHAQVLTTSSSLDPSLRLYKEATTLVPDYYPNGYAASGWSGETAIGDNVDFLIELALESDKLNEAPIGWYTSRWGDYTEQKAEELADIYSQVVMPYLAGVSFADYQEHIWAVGNQRTQMLFEFNRNDVVNENYSVFDSYLNSFGSNSVYGPNPSVMGWYLYDEPYGHSISVTPLENVYAYIDAIDNKPVFMAFTPQAVEAHQLEVYKDAYDVMMIDRYPFNPGEAEFQDIESWQNTMAATETASQIVGKPWWSIIQAMGTGWREDDSDNWRLPTYDEMRFMTFWSVLEGATGIMNWMYDTALNSEADASQPYPYDGQQWLQDVAIPITQDYRGCAGAIAGGCVEDAVSVAGSSNVVAKVYKSDVDEYILIAANHEANIESNVALSLDIPNVNLPPEENDPNYYAVILSENRSIISLTTDTITDSFDPYQVHIYRIMSDEQVVEKLSNDDDEWLWWKVCKDYSSDPTEPNHVAAVQWFQVPEGTVGTKFEFFTSIGSAPPESGYVVNVALFKDDGTYIGIGQKSADQYTASNEWVAVEDLHLAPGRYYAQLWTNHPVFQGYLSTILIPNSGYADGFAANGWGGGSRLNPRDDFRTALTVVPALEISGTVDLQGYIGDSADVSVNMELKDISTGEVLESYDVDLEKNGSYRFVTTNSDDNYYLSAKASHWLRKEIAAVVPRAGVNLSLINGDVNGSNNIDVDDLVDYVSSYLELDVSNNPADLNGDTNVDLLDIGIMAENWLVYGD